MFPYRVFALRRVLAGILLLLLMAVTACGSSVQSSSSNNSSGPVQVVAAENFWGNIAAQVGDVEFVKALLAKGANPNVTTAQARLPVRGGGG